MNDDRIPSWQHGGSTAFQLKRKRDSMPEIIEAMEDAVYNLALLREGLFDLADRLDARIAETGDEWLGEQLKAVNWMLGETA